MGRPLTIMAHLKRIIEIRSETKCRAHALIIAIARITDEPNYKAYRQGFNILPAVQHLLVTTGIDLQNGGGIHELQRFQDHFTEYKIVVYGGLDCGDIIFEGQVTSEKRINLLYDDVSQHYHVIANLTGAMAERYVCKGCNKVCRSTVSHKCQETCNVCMFILPCVFIFETRVSRAIERLKGNIFSTSTNLINWKERLYVSKRETVRIVAVCQILIIIKPT